MRRVLLRLAAYLALASWLTWPVVLTPGSRVPGASRTDLWDSLWGLWFVAQSARDGVLPWHTTWLGWPDGGVIVVADPVNAILATPVALLLGVSATYSLLVLFHLTLSGLAAHALAEELFEAPGAGWLAGVAWTCAPVLLSAIQNGTSEAIAGAWLAFALLACLRAARRGGVLGCGVAGLAMAVAAWGSWYAGVCAWIFWACLLVSAPTGQRAERARRLVGAAALALALTLPVAALMQMGSTDADNLVGIKNPKELMSVRRTIGAADPRGWFAVGDFRSPDFRVLSRYGEEFIHCTYLGWTLLILGGVGLWRGRTREGLPGVKAALALAGFIGFVLAMGPVVSMDGQAWILRGRLAVPLPYILLERLPGFSGLSLLYRLGMLPALALSVLAGGALGPRLGRVWPAVVLAVVLDLRGLSPTRGLPDTEPVDDVAPLHWLAAAPEGAVMNFPVVGGRAYLWEQATHQKPIAGSLNFPNNTASRRVWAAILEAERLGEDSAAARARVGAAASRERIRYLVVHVDPMARPDMHDAAVRAVKGWYTPASETTAVKVFQLW